MRCYLDYNASAPLLKEVKDYVLSVMEIEGNPSSIHNNTNNLIVINSKNKKNYFLDSVDDNVHNE